MIYEFLWKLGRMGVKEGSSEEVSLYKSLGLKIVFWGEV